VINLRNVREVNLASGNVSATVPPHVLAASGVVTRYVAPTDGRVKALVAATAAAPTAGGTNHKQVLRVRNAGYAGSATDVITDDVVAKDETPTPDDLPAVGTVRSASGLNVAANFVKAGQILEVHHNETGTPGGGDASVNVVAVLFESAYNLDPTD